MIDNARPLRTLLAALAVHRSGVVCPGADALADHLRQVLPFAVHHFKSGDDHNGWIVPSHWSVQHATFRSTGVARTLDGDRPTLSYDGLASPLGVCSYSQPFQGTVRGGDLKKHLYYSQAFPDQLIYHCDWLYKPHIKDWGFCVPKAIHDRIADAGLYEVDLRTSFKDGAMHVLEYVLPGKVPDSIILNAHTCHPGLANDDLAGCVVGIEVMRRLQALRDRHYTYRLILAPEHYGSIFYIRQEITGYQRVTARYALFLESLGSIGPLALQRSFRGHSRMDRALALALGGHQHRSEPFREIVGNDETCWEAAGVEIPCPSLSRVPFPEYHTSLDTVDIIHEDKLREAVNVVFDALIMLDSDVTAQRKFTGLVCLSNPQYDLYQPFLDPSIPDRRSISEDQRNWNRLMNHLPRHFDGHTTCIDLAERFNLPFVKVLDYLQAWADKGLISLHPA